MAEKGTLNHGSEWEVQPLMLELSCKDRDWSCQQWASTRKDLGLLGTIGGRNIKKWEFNQEKNVKQW